MRASSYLADCQSETPTCNCVRFKCKIQFEIQFGCWQLLKKNNPTNNQDNYKPVDFRVNSYQCHGNGLLWDHVWSGAAFYIISVTVRKLKALFRAASNSFSFEQERIIPLLKDIWCDYNKGYSLTIACQTILWLNSRNFDGCHLFDFNIFQRY